MIKIIIVHHTQVNQVEFYYVLKVKNISNTRTIFIIYLSLLRTAEGEGSAAVLRTAARCEQSWWKVKKKHLNTPRYEYRIQWRLYTWWLNQVNSDGPIWVEMCVCRKQGGVQWLVSCDLSNVMHRDSAVEGGATKHEKGDSWEIYISEPMGELWFGEEICWT